RRLADHCSRFVNASRHRNRITAPWLACQTGTVPPRHAAPDQPGRPAAAPPTAEHARLAESPDPSDPWRLWGPYLAGRQWGTVREDYSADGDAWGYFPFEQAEARAYRWGEDGLGGICDRFGFLNFAV